MDLIDDRDSRPSRRTTTAIGAALLLIAVLLAGAAADRWQREREVDQLLARAGAAQGTISYADQRIAGTLSYVSPQIRQPSAPARVRASLRAIVQEEAAGQLSALKADRTAMAETWIIRWHDEQRTARRAYVDYLDARLGYFEAVAGDLAELSVPRPELAARHEAARSALAAAAGHAPVGGAPGGPAG